MGVNLGRFSVRRANIAPVTCLVVVNINQSILAYFACWLVVATLWLCLHARFQEPWERWAGEGLSCLVRNLLLVPNSLFCSFKSHLLQAWISPFDGDSAAKATSTIVKGWLVPGFGHSHPPTWPFLFLSFFLFWYNLSSQNFHGFFCCPLSDSVGANTSLSCWIVHHCHYLSLTYFTNYMQLIKKLINPKATSKAYTLGRFRGRKQHHMWVYHSEHHVDYFLFCFQPYRNMAKMLSLFFFLTIYLFIHLVNSTCL